MFFLYLLLSEHIPNVVFSMSENIVALTHAAFGPGFAVVNCETVHRPPEIVVTDIFKTGKVDLFLIIQFLYFPL